MAKLLNFPEIYYHELSQYDVIELKNKIEYNTVMIEKLFEILFQALESKPRYEVESKRVNAVVSIFLSNLKKRVEDLEKDFDDIYERIFNCGSILHNLEKIINLLKEDIIEEKYVLRMAIIIHDLIKKVNAEDLNREHLDIIKKAIFKMASGKVEKRDVVEVDYALLDSGVDWIFGG